MFCRLPHKVPLAELEAMELRAEANEAFLKGERNVRRRDLRRAFDSFKLDDDEALRVSNAIAG